MADSKITALTAISTVDPTADPLVIVDVSDTSMAASGTTKKSTINQLLGSGGTATLASATITGDLTAARLIITGGTIPTNGLWLPTTNTLEFAANSLAQYRIAPLGVFSWFDGAGGTRMTLNSTGLGVGVVPSAGKGALQLSSGINFPATQVASSDANTLDDYEEGTFTPTVGGTATYTTQTGRYTKIGNRVYVNMRLEILLIGTGSSFLISGLPFTSGVTSNLSSASVGYFGSLAISANYIAGYIASGGSTVRMTGTTAASANITNGIGVIGNATDLALSFFYEV